MSSLSSEVFLCPENLGKWDRERKTGYFPEDATFLWASAISLPFPPGLLKSGWPFPLATGPGIRTSAWSLLCGHPTGRLWGGAGGWKAQSRDGILQILTRP